MTELDLTSPDTYSYWSDELIRFADIDRLNHVNNVAFATYSESGRVEFLEEVIPGCTDGSGIGWVIAKLTISYLAPAYYPGRVKIGNVITKVGNSSIIIQQGLFNGETCFGTCENILVWADTENGTSIPMSEAIKEKLSVYAK